MTPIGSEDLKLLIQKHNAHLFNGLPIGYTNCNIKGTVEEKNVKEHADEAAQSQNHHRQDGNDKATGKFSKNVGIRRTNNSRPVESRKIA